MDVKERRHFANRCHTTLGYLRKAISAQHKPRIELVMALVRESDGVLTAADLRPDIDWAQVSRGESA